MYLMMNNREQTIKDTQRRERGVMRTHMTGTAYARGVDGLWGT